MDYALFWHLVDSTRGQSERTDRLIDLLKQRSPEEIIQFRLLYDDLIATANKFDLWGAAHAINGGCTDEGFYFFREGLIEIGRAVFESAVNDPDSLVDVAQPGVPIEGTEGLGSAALAAWMVATGKTEEQFYEAVDNADTRTDRGDAEEGEWWSFHDKAEVRHRLPRLAAKYMHDDSE